MIDILFMVMGDVVKQLHLAISYIENVHFHNNMKVYVSFVESI